MIGDYTDFYASIDHATNVGRMFRPENPLLPNYRWMPIAYHGRSSSIVVSGTAVRRPRGQIVEKAGEAPVYVPGRQLDYELELGAFLGPGNIMGEPIPVAEAEEHLFGVCLLNDWSARDIQTWESQPLGPFLSKNFATSISPWVVTREALAPFRCDAPKHEVLPHLRAADGAYRIRLEVWLRSAKMQEPVLLSHSDFRVDVLDAGADDCASHVEWLSGTRGRFDWERNGVRAGEAKPGVSAGNDFARSGTHRTSDGGDAEFPGRRR